jgi:hypothetical protein
MLFLFMEYINFEPINPIFYLSPLLNHDSPDYRDGPIPRAARSAAAALAAARMMPPAAGADAAGGFGGELDDDGRRA